MAILSYPTYNSEIMVPDNITFTLRYNTQVHVSALTGYTQTLELPGARWAARMDYTNLSREETDTLIAWLTRLKGMAGRFTMYDFSNPTTLNGTTGGTLASSNAATTSGDDSILTFASTPTGGALVVGDKFSINGNYELKTVVQVNSSTEYVVTPGFREVLTYYNSKTILVGTSATVKMMLDSDDQATKAVESKLLLGNVSISCVEIF